LYEPKLAAPVLTVSSGAAAARYRFDHEQKAWKRLGPTPRELVWNEYYATYVPLWKRYVISTAKRGWFRYDVAAGTVQGIEFPERLERCQSLSCDAKHDVVIALERNVLRKGWQTVVPWALDVSTLEWTELAPPRPWPEGQGTGNWTTLWYDPEHNVHLLVNFVKRDRQELYDGGVTETWAYRFKR
jgi:hypothetical protein